MDERGWESKRDISKRVKHLSPHGVGCALCDTRSLHVRAHKRAIAVHVSSFRCSDSTRHAFSILVMGGGFVHFEVRVESIGAVVVVVVEKTKTYTCFENRLLIGLQNKI
jgi:hypothetical protein